MESGKSKLRARLNWRKIKTHFRLRLSCTIHSTLSHLQFPQGAPSTTSHRTFRARHETQALAARLLVTFGGAEGSAPLLARFFGAAEFWEAALGGLIVVAAGEIVSGLAVAGASIGGVGIGAGLLCVDILVAKDSMPVRELEDWASFLFSVAAYLAKLGGRIDTRVV